METNVSYTVVGAFVVLLTATIICSIIWLSSGFSYGQYMTYQVDMKESVSGLTPDAPVEYNGVNVGTVTSIALNHKDPHIVNLLLSINTKTPITRGTVAMLGTRGITGNAFMALKDNGENMYPLHARQGEDYPVIPTAPSLFLRLDTALTQISTSFKGMSDAMQGVFNDENRLLIKEILLNIKQVSGVLAGNSDKINALISNTHEASQHLTPLLKSGATTMNMLQTQTMPGTYQLLSNLNNVIRTLSEVATELKHNPSILIRGAASGAPGPGEAP